MAKKKYDRHICHICRNAVDDSQIWNYTIHEMISESIYELDFWTAKLLYTGWGRWRRGGAIGLSVDLPEPVLHLGPMNRTSAMSSRS